MLARHYTTGARGRHFFPLGEYGPFSAFWSNCLGPNHTQYKISLTFSHKTTFERDLRPHTPLYVSFSYKSPGFHINRTRKQDAYKCRVPQSSSVAGKRRNDKTCLSTPPRNLICDERYVNIFMKVALTTSMTPYETWFNIIPSVVWPLASSVFIFSDFVTVFFLIVFVYSRAKIRCYRFFNFDLRKVMLRQSRPGRVKQRFRRLFVHISTSRAKLKVL